MRISTRPTRRGRLVIAAVAASLGLACVSAAGGAPPDVEAEIMAVLDRYMDALNDLDIERHVSTYHFPHYRHAHGEIVVWQNAQEAMPVLALASEDRRAMLRKVLEPDWHRSEWTRREIVQTGPSKVHVVTRFERLREGGSVIKAFDSLYVLTLEADAAGKRRWGIKGRSSYAP